jgi:hypothetical protein
MTYNSAKSLIFARRVDRELEGYLQAFSESDITCVPAIAGEAEEWLMMFMITCRQAHR